MHTNKFLFLAVAVGLAFFIWWGWPSQRAQHHNPDQPAALVVGTNVGYPPFIFRDQDGSITGFDRDVARQIAARLQRPLIIKDMSFDALLLALPQESVDMIVGGISITSARKSKGWLLPYYGNTVDQVALMYRADKVAHGTTLAQAAQQGITVCTQAGSSFEEILESFEGLRVKTLPDISDLFIEVERSGSDIAVLDVDTVQVLTRGRAWLQSHTEQLPAHLHIDGFGIGIAPFNKQLRESVANIIAHMHADGTIKRLAQKWF